MEIDDMPELVGLVERIAKSKRGIILRRDGKDVASIKPLPAVAEQKPAQKRRRHRPTTADDPLWQIIGIGSSAEPTDIAKFKDQYLAEAYGNLHETE